MVEAPWHETHVLQPGEGKRAPREIAHPLQPELLVAHLSGELPPAAIQVVREHLDACDACATRSRALAGPYAALATLGAQPVRFVPDLRRPVRERWARSHAPAHIAQVARVVGGGSLAGVAAIVAVVLVLTLVVVTNTFQVPLSTTRSANGAGAPATVAGSGLLYAETAKVMDVTAPDGATWPAAEVIAVNQRSAAVVRSLPQTARNLRIGAADERPLAVALAPDGRIIYELSAPRRGRQALLAFATHTGELLFATVLAQPDQRALPEGLLARALAIAPGGQQVYIDLSGAPALDGEPFILVLDRQGRGLQALFHPRIPGAVYEPAPGGGLPGVAGLPTGPGFDTANMPRTVVDGALGVSADGRSLFDAVILRNGVIPVAVVVSRIVATTGQTVQSIALPGDYSVAGMAVSQSASAQLLYLAQVGTQGAVSVIDVSGTGLVVHSEIPLGGLSVPAQTSVAGTLSVSPTVDGTQAYVSADTSGAGVSSHDLWLVDGLSNTVASHRIEFIAAGQALPDGASGNGATVFVMRGSEIVLLPPDLALETSPPVWLRLADGQPLLRLIATSAS